MKTGVLVVLSTIFCVRGGIPRFNQMLCLALDRLAPKLDLDVTVISQDDSEEDYEAAGAPWKHMRFVAGAGQAGTARRTLVEAARKRPTVAIIGLLGMTPAGLLARPFLKQGYGFIAHGTEAWEEPRRSRRIAARNASFAFAVSANTGSALTRSTGIPIERVHVLPNTLDPYFSEQLERNRGKETTEERGLELLTVSRLWAVETMKGVDRAIEAFAQLAERYPDARYRIVGKGDDKPRLEALAREHGVVDRVLFEQDLSDDDLRDRYKHCAAFVLPSGQEGFGIVFLESMQFAKPCIGGKAGGTPEVVIDGETGILVPFGDVDALRRAMDRLLGDAELRRTLGEAGRRRLFDCFLFDRYCERVEELLTAALQGDIQGVPATVPAAEAE
ncbi:hypothetical protein ABI59_04865 [Acidobacteria bacterium Mor1]|nr:hypothetical protein ABI59_04865 [Acidobacteria bacterium Mor1]